ncbi:serine beta-lactamase-like protein LACTB, mitochondrial [Oratosquilla oratoria]|uniref:serine beta-lactamase-like protein LACTB, mitochondrial n=1 Tax=Oratosquilla oratoria TaxID=337810 RepID=UPI003F7714EE
MFRRLFHPSACSQGFCMRNLASCVSRCNERGWFHLRKARCFRNYSHGSCYKGQKTFGSDEGTLQPWKNNSKRKWSKAAGFTVVGIGAFASCILAYCEAADNEEKNEEEKCTCHEEDNPLGKIESPNFDVIPKNNITNGIEKPVKNLTLEEAIHESVDLLYQTMEIAGIPGLSVGVTVDGCNVWSTGLGYADIENKLPCTKHTVMRIASISKPLTMMAVARLWEEGKIDLDAPVQKYVPKFPKKMYEAKEVTITTRQLLSHQGGIRHYKKKNGKKNSDVKNTLPKKQDESSEKEETKEVPDEKSSTSEEEKEVANPEHIELKNIKTSASNNEQNHSTVKRETTKKHEREGKKKRGKENEFDSKEYFIKEEFKDIESALKLFQDDDLFFKPGTGYLYTTHGWTLISAVVEGAAEKPFTEVMCKLFHDLGLNNTYLDQHRPIIFNRARYYIRNKHNRLINAPYVDNSYKWAGGGFLSTVGDLTKFGNAVLYSYQRKEDSKDLLLGILKASTVKEMWKPTEGTKMDWDQDGSYGLGWGVVEEKCKHGFCRACRHYVSHTGGAIGASSVLLILPSNDDLTENEVPPKGVVVAILCNMQNAGLNKVGLKIAKLFERVPS